MDVVMRFIDMIKQRKRGTLYSEPEIYEEYILCISAFAKRSNECRSALSKAVVDWISKPNYVIIDHWFLELSVGMMVDIMMELKYEPLVRYY